MALWTPAGVAPLCKPPQLTVLTRCVCCDTCSLGEGGRAGGWGVGCRQIIKIKMDTGEQVKVM